MARRRAPALPAERRLPDPKQKTAKQALDAMAADWQRTLHRAGVGRA